MISARLNFSYLPFPYTMATKRQNKKPDCKSHTRITSTYMSLICRNEKPFTTDTDDCGGADDDGGVVGSQNSMIASTPAPKPPPTSTGPGTLPKGVDTPKTKPPPAFTPGAARGVHDTPKATPPAVAAGVDRRQSFQNSFESFLTTDWDAKKSVNVKPPVPAAEETKDTTPSPAKTPQNFEEFVAQQLRNREKEAKKAEKVQFIRPKNFIRCAPSQLSFDIYVFFSGTWKWWERPGPWPGW